MAANAAKSTINNVSSGVSQTVKQTVKVAQALVKSSTAKQASTEAAQASSSVAQTIKLGKSANQVIQSSHTSGKNPAINPDCTNLTSLEMKANLVENISAKIPTGSKGNPLIIPDGLNQSTIINNRVFSGHALDRMQKQGITPSIVENAMVLKNAVKGKNRGLLLIMTWKIK